MAPHSILTIFSLLFGLSLGSFLNVCIYRIPLKMSIIKPPSSCPRCGKNIKFYDNIPIISFILLKGKCRNCSQPIPIRYPIVEMITGLLSLALFIIYDLSSLYFLFLAFSASLVVISYIDLQNRIIPDIISLPGVAAGLAVSFFAGHIPWYNSLIGIIVGGGGFYLIAVVFEKITGKEGMGGGDIKLMAMIGAWLGWKALPFIILLSSLSGILIGGGSLLISKQGLQTKIPFGPFLVLGALIYLFFGHEIVAWYYNLTYQQGALP